MLTPRFPIVLVNLTRFGFEPSESTIPAGQCLIAIANISGMRQVDLRLSRKAGAQLVAENYPQGRRHWEKVLDLMPGEYALTVVGHPELVLKIIVNQPER